MAKKSYITVTDQFCGAGGSSIGVQTKICRVCLKELPLAQFYARPDSPDGLRNDCKDCTKNRSHQSAERNVEKRREYMKQYAEKNRLHLNTEARRRAETNSRKLYFRRYRVINKPTVQKNEQRYRQNNRHKEVARRHARRAMPLTDQAREYIAILQNDPCSYCGTAGGTIDHIIPVAKGGTNDWDNLTAACLSCNSKKHDRHLLTFLLEIF